MRFSVLLGRFLALFGRSWVDLGNFGGIPVAGARWLGLGLGWLGLAALLGLAGLCGALLGSAGLCWALLGFDGLCWALLRFAGLCCALLAFAGLCWALLGLAGLSWALLGFAGLCWALLSFAGLCWSVLAFAGLCWVLLGLAEPCWLLLGFGLSWGRLRKARKGRAVHVLVNRCAFRSPARSGLMPLGGLVGLMLASWASLGRLFLCFGRICV